jgi:hypothetical protein
MGNRPLDGGKAIVAVRLAITSIVVALGVVRIADGHVLFGTLFIAAALARLLMLALLRRRMARLRGERRARWTRDGDPSIRERDTRR